MNETKQIPKDCPKCGAKYLYPRWTRCEICAKIAESIKPLNLDAIRVCQLRYIQSYSPDAYDLGRMIISDIPALCDEVEALRKRVKELEETIKNG